MHAIAPIGCWHFSCFNSVHASVGKTQEEPLQAWSASVPCQTDCFARDLALLVWSCPLSVVELLYREAEVERFRIRDRGFLTRPPGQSIAPALFKPEAEAVSPVRCLDFRTASSLTPFASSRRNTELQEDRTRRKQKDIIAPGRQFPAHIAAANPTVQVSRQLCPDTSYGEGEDCLPLLCQKC